jgi:hypothetical protein
MYTFTYKPETTDWLSIPLKTKVQIILWSQSKNSWTSGGWQPEITVNCKCNVYCPSRMRKYSNKANTDLGGCGVLRVISRVLLMIICIILVSVNFIGAAVQVIMAIVTLIFRIADWSQPP